MSSVKSKAKAIREELKAIGYKPSQVSVRVGGGAYDSSIDVILKDIKISIDWISQITKKYEKIDYCERSGEILCGGNTYVSVSWDYNTMQKAIDARIEKAKEIYQRGVEISLLKYQNSITIMENGIHELVYYPKEYKIYSFKRPENYKDLECYCPETISSYYANSSYAIAEAMVYFENKMIK
jgi:hypothetical protein